MLNLNENTSLNGTITIKNGEVEVPVLNISANLNKDGTNFNLNFNSLNKDLLAANATEVQTQFNSFLDSLKTKMSERNYPITIR